MSAPLQVRSLWEATAAPGPEFAALAAPVSAQAVVIGAGYTGLSAALHLARAGRDVVVLEAARIGERASGLNGGQVIPGVKDDPDELQERFGAGPGARMVDTVAGGPDLVFDLIREHAIACDATRTGWIQPATSETALRQLQRRVRQWQQRGAPLRMLSAAEVAALTGSSRYCGGLLDPRGGTVQPLAYVRGLARAAAAAGARIFARTAALRLVKTTTGWEVGTAAASAAAPVVILATNAYTDSISDTLRRSVVPVPSFQVATQPLPASLRAQILPGGQAASDTWRLLRYFRVESSGRLVMGSRGTYARAPRLAAVKHHYRAVAEIFPQLDGIGFEYHWGGMVAVTPDHLPHLHEPAPGLLAGLGYNGRGVAMATVMGRLLARRVLGAPADELGFPITPLKPVALHAFSRLGVRATVQYLRLADALTARRQPRVAGA
ncbi:MAG: FAD-binding oxidoreductase [Proteobacteria bacterium]|nr:FAD-binding oxidoreductase [Pseudomonadota bacterium]